MEAFSYADLDWQRYVTIDPKLLRPAEVDHLIGNSSKAQTVLNWQPQVDFRHLVRMMVDADIARLSTGGRRESAVITS